MDRMNACSLVALLGCEAEPGVLTVVEEEVILLQQIAQNGEADGWKDDQASGAQVVDGHERVGLREGERGAGEVDGDGREHGLLHRGQIVAQPETELRCVNQRVLNQRHERSSQRIVSFGGQEVESGPGIHNGAAAPVAIDVERRPRDIQHPPVDAQILHLQIVETGRKLVPDQSSVAHGRRELRRLRASDDQRARLAHSILECDQAVGEFVPEFGGQLGHHRQGPSAQPHEPIGAREVPAIVRPAAESEVGEGVLSSASVGQSDGLEPQAPVRVRAVSIAVAVLAQIVGAGREQQRVAEGAVAIHFAERRRLAGVEERVRLREAVVAGLALHPHQVAARVQDGRESPRRSAQRHVHDVLAHLREHGRNSRTRTRCSHRLVLLGSIFRPRSLGLGQQQLQRSGPSSAAFGCSGIALSETERSR
ncbi:hypothetical protein Mapa_005398 [Marchantia paleacea]|nr:hypothetical protein Mapa_005398 [Marchantia paleacea]